MWSRGSKQFLVPAIAVSCLMVSIARAQEAPAVTPDSAAASIPVVTSNCSYALRNTPHVLQYLPSEDCRQVFVVPKSIIGMRIKDVKGSVGVDQCGAVETRLSEINSKIFELKIKRSKYDVQSRKDRQLIAQFDTQIRILTDEQNRLEAMRSSLYVEASLEFPKRKQKGLERIAEDAKLENIQLLEDRQLDFRPARFEVAVASIALAEDVEVTSQERISDEGVRAEDDFAMSDKPGELRFSAAEEGTPAVSIRIGPTYACQIGQAQDEQQKLALIERLVIGNITLGINVRDENVTENADKTRTLFLTDALTLIKTKKQER